MMPALDLDLGDAGPSPIKLEGSCVSSIPHLHLEGPIPGFCWAVAQQPLVTGCTPGLEKAGVCPVAPLPGGSATRGGNLKKVTVSISVGSGGRGVMTTQPRITQKEEEKTGLKRSLEM